MLAAWIAGPSAIGSVNGMPSSIASAPPATSASRIGPVASVVGSPAVTNATSAARPAAAVRAKVAARRLTCPPPASGRGWGWAPGLR